MGYTVAIIGLVASLVGAGISAYGQYQTGKTQEAIAAANAATQTRNAQMALMAQQAQAAMARNQAAANFQLRSQEAQARFNNAASMENKALSTDMVARENARKRAEDMARMQSQQRAAIAASGVVESSGTPLDLLVETAGIIQRDREEAAWSHEIERRTLLREAQMERLGGQFALAGATLDRNSALAEASLRGAAGRANYLSGLREAEITRLTGSAAGKAATWNAAGTLLSGIASSAGSYYNLNSQGAFRAS